MYTAALVVHLAGVVLLLGAVTITTVATLRAQTTPSVAALRKLTTVKSKTGAAIGPVLLVIVAAGLYMASRHGDDGSIRWSDGWLDVAMMAVAIMAALGPTVEGRHARRLLRLAAARPDGPVPPELDGVRRAALPSHVSLFGAGQIVAVLYLMLVKPGWLGAVLAFALAGAVGVAVSAVRLHRIGRTAVAAPTRSKALSS